MYIPSMLTNCLHNQDENGFMLQWCYTILLHCSYTVFLWRSYICMFVLLVGHWYNKSWRQKQLTPSYIAIKINGNKPRCCKTIKAATQYWINQELKFLYVKKQRLNEQLYKIHLECTSFWQNNWYIIQPSTDNKLQHQIETYYTHLNKKLDRL